MADNSNVIETQFAFAFLTFWLLLVVLFAKLVRVGQSGNVVAPKAGELSDRTHSSVVQHFLRHDRERAEMGLRMEKVSRSYMSTKIGQAHVIALGIFATSTLVLGIWKLALDKSAVGSRQSNEISNAHL